MQPVSYTHLDVYKRQFLIFFVLPLFGLQAYIWVFFFSTILNAGFSLGRLLKVCDLHFRIGKWLIKPLLCASASVFLAKISGMPFALQVAASLLLYLLLVILCQSFSKEDLHWLKSLGKA